MPDHGEVSFGLMPYGRIYRHFQCCPLILNINFLNNLLTSIMFFEMYIKIPLKV
jgi:hypothetical protein